MRVGFIGLGAMGLPMARNLLTAGHEVTVTSRSRPSIDAAVAAGASDGGSHVGVAERSDIMIISVPLSPDVCQVVDAIMPALGPGKTVVDCSTIEPDTEIALHQRVNATGAEYLEAPVSGGPDIATAGTLAIMTGGCARTDARARPVLKAFSRIVVHMGGPGAGQSAKLCNNLIHAAQNLAVAEACALAIRAGVDIATFRQVVLHSTGDCTAIRNRVPIPGIVPGSPASQGWNGFPIEMMIKEMDMVIEFGRQKGLPIVSTRIYRSLLAVADRLGLGSEDFSAAGKLLQYPHLYPEAERWLVQTASAVDKSSSSELRGP